MARKNRIKFEFDGMYKLMGQLEEAGGKKAIDEAVTNALVESKNYVTPLIEKAMNKLPAGGRYSTGETKQSIDKSTDIEWFGNMAQIKVGFNFNESGMKSIFLIYGTEVNGTPRMPPVKGLKSALYGTKTKKAVAQIQNDEVVKVLNRILGG